MLTTISSSTAAPEHEHSSIYAYAKSTTTPIVRSLFDMFEDTPNTITAPKSLFNEKPQWLIGTKSESQVIQLAPEETTPVHLLKKTPVSFIITMFTAKGTAIFRPTVKINGRRINTNEGQIEPNHYKSEFRLTLHYANPNDIIEALYIDFDDNKRKYSQLYQVQADHSVKYLEPTQRRGKTKTNVVPPYIVYSDNTPHEILDEQIETTNYSDYHQINTDAEVKTDYSDSYTIIEHDKEQKPERKVSFTQELPHQHLTKLRLTDTERQELLDEYVTRGRSLVIENDRGLIDSNIRRESNLAQFFTPSKVTKVLTQALGIAYHPNWGEAWSETLPDYKAVDFSGCGNGRLFQYLPKTWKLSGADVDPHAVRAAKLIYPDAEILETSMENFKFLNEVSEVSDKKPKPYHLAILNPPFNVRLTTRTKSNLLSAEWGIWGEKTGLNSHLAAFEMAFQVAHTVAVILPTSTLTGEHSTKIEKIEKKNKSFQRILRIDLPPEAFESEGTLWPCTLLIYSMYEMDTVTNTTCLSWDEVEDTVAKHVINLRSEYLENYKTAYHRPTFSCAFHHTMTNTYSVEKNKCLSHYLSDAKKAAAKQIFAKKEIPHTNETPTVRLCLGGRGHKISLKANNLVARLMIEETRLNLGYITSAKYDPNDMLSWRCDLVRNAGQICNQIPTICKALKKTDPNMNVIVDEQLIRYAKKLDKLTAIELTPHAQWIENTEDGTWSKIFNEDINLTQHPAFEVIQSKHNLYQKNVKAISSGSAIKKWDRSLRRHVDFQYPPVQLYDFTKTDIVRTLGRKAVIYSAKQGLGKTRFSIGTVLASGVSKALWILETRLVNEFKIELEKLGLSEHFHLIKTQNDLKNLKLFNVITYNRLWTAIPGRQRAKDENKSQWGTGNTFAAELAKRHLTVIIDEAHKIKAEEAKQSRAAQHLCKRAKRVILMTGTVIQSYARNILGLTNAAWNEGSAINPYGYGRYNLRPIIGNYPVETDTESYRSRRIWRDPLIKGTQKFIDTYMTITWYSSEFASTASQGRKSREMPQIRNLPEWNSFKQSKIIRRQPAEPEVRASGLTTPVAQPIYVPVTPRPEHSAYYRYVLDHFAHIWEERLKEEKRSVGNSPNAHILPELNALRSASTVPSIELSWASKNADIKKFQFKEPTAVMLKTVELVRKWMSEGEKVIIGSEKPDALAQIATMLSQKSEDENYSDPVPFIFANDENIDNRNQQIETAKNRQFPSVLLITVGKGKEGLNLPQFSRLITIDLGWKPGDLDQFRHRILRPGQVQDCQIIHLYHSAMIDEYMRQMCDAKSEMIGEGIDGKENNFDYDQWQDHRTFALKLLADSGYEFARKELMRIAQNQ